MNAKTLKALRGSIRKWQAIVAGTGRDRGASNCPLCKVFNDQGNFCRGCPVQAKTKTHSCYGSPYHDFYQESTIDGRAVSDRAIVLAAKELRFLISLLPTTKG